jgi:hypothetical protein
MALEAAAATAAADVGLVSLAFDGVLDEDEEDEGDPLPPMLLPPDG